MDQDTRVPVIIIYGDRRHVFFKPQKYDTLIQLARSYFCIPRGKTLAVSTAPAEYDAMPIAYIYFALGEQTVDRIGRHMVADIYGPPPPVPSTASTEEEVWKNLPWKDWEEVRGMLVMTYQSPNETLVVISEL